jgi:hypothetical protein
MRRAMKCGRQVNIPLLVGQPITDCASTGYDALHVSCCAEVSISTPL